MLQHTTSQADGPSCNGAHGQISTTGPPAVGVVVRRLKEELNLDWDSKFSDLNLDLILNLVLLPKNFKMENHENHAPRAIARIKCRNSCTGTMMQLHGTCQLNL